MSSDAELAAEQLPVAIWMGKVPSGEVVYTNRAFREVLGIEPPPGASRGAFVEPYGVHTIDGAPYPEEKMPFERCVVAREAVVIDDLVIHRRDGRRVNLRVFAKPVFDADGNMTHVLEAFTDITREVEAERARVEGDKKLAFAERLQSIGQLVTGIAHDFNNLLAVAKLAVSQLLRGEDDPERRETLGDVEAVTDSGIALVRNLLGFAGRGPRPLAPLELGQLVSAVVGLSRHTFERGITLETDGAHDAWITGDASQLEQVLMNLLVNARDAITGSGRIVVTTRVGVLRAGQVENCTVGRYVVLEVTDNGCGIDPSIRDRIFEPYFTTKTLGPIKGTGLGLSTVHGIVRTHAGFLEARAVSPRGTTLRIAIPACEPPPEDPSVGEASRPPPLARGEGQLVLVIDDERMVRAATRRSLEALGYTVVEAEGGTAGLEQFAARRGEIAAVVLDMIMPGISAREVYANLRASRPDVPVIVSTGSAMSDELRALLDLGVRAHLAKPFEERELADALRRVL